MKNLFIALSFIALTGIMQQVCGMEKEEKDSLPTGNFHSSQTGSKKLIRSVSNPDLHKSSNAGLEKRVTDIEKTLTQFTPLAVTDLHELETKKIMPLLSSDDKNKISNRLDNLENMVSKLYNNSDIKFLLSEEEKYSSAAKAENDTYIFPLEQIINDVDTLNNNHLASLQILFAKEKTKRTYLSRAGNFAQFIGCTLLASFGTWTVYNIIKKSNGIQDAATTLFKSKDGLLGLGTLLFGLPNMYPSLVKTLRPKTPVHDSIERGKEDQEKAKKEIEQKKDNDKDKKE